MSEELEKLAREETLPELLERLASEEAVDFLLEYEWIKVGSHKDRQRLEQNIARALHAEGWFTYQIDAALSRAVASARQARDVEWVTVLFPDPDSKVLREFGIAPDKSRLLIDEAMKLTAEAARQEMLEKACAAIRGARLTLETSQAAECAVRRAFADEQEKG